MNGGEANNKWPCSKYSICKSVILKLVTVGIIWGVGYMKWNIAWLIPAAFWVAIKNERKKEGDLKKLVAQATALSNEKVIINNRVDELPTWVYFPDFDRAEWLNGILIKMWPNVNHFVRDLFKTQIQELVRERLVDYNIKIPGVGQDFRFDRIVLGRIPPKVNGVKTYDKNTSRNEIVMDMDIMYAGDCDISFFMGNLKAGIKDLQLRGMMRVTLKPLLKIIPLCGGVQVYFLNKPVIDFNLVGLADVLDLPGFSDLMRKVINEQVAALAVVPNKIILPLTTEIPAESIKTPEPEGVLRIHVVQAKHLMKKDIGVLGKGKSDPYAIITVGAEEFRTKTIDNTVDPKWDYWCETAITSSIRQQIDLSIWDWDPNVPGVQGDDFLGRATIDVDQVKKKGIVDTWVSLEEAKHGMVQIRLTWLQLTSDINDLAAALKETQELRVTSMSTAVLILYVDSARSLPCLKGSKQPDAYLEASIDGKSQRTVTILRSSDPVWEQGFIFLVQNPQNGILHIKIHDQKTATVIGSLSYNISNLMEIDSLEIKQQPLSIKNANVESRIILSIGLRLLKYVAPETAFEDEEYQDITGSEKNLERQASSISRISKISSSVSVEGQLSKDSDNNLITKASAGSLDTAPEIFNTDTAATTIIPQYSQDSNASAELFHRQTSFSLSSGSSKLGRMQITLKYSVQRQKLLVVIHKIANLPLPPNDPSNIPDPYVKLYLLPDRHKETKRKTAVKKDNCSPTFDEQFEYIVSQGDINTRVLQLSVCTQKGWLSAGNNIIGQVHINLSEIDFTQTNTMWFDLEPEGKN